MTCHTQPRPPAYPSPLELHGGLQRPGLTVCMCSLLLQAAWAEEAPTAPQQGRGSASCRAAGEGGSALLPQCLSAQTFLAV